VPPSCSPFSQQTIIGQIATNWLSRPLCEWSHNLPIIYLLLARWASCWQLILWKRTVWLHFRGIKLWLHWFQLHPSRPCLSLWNRPGHQSLLLSAGFASTPPLAISTLLPIKPAFPFPAGVQHWPIPVVRCERFALHANFNEIVWYFLISLSSFVTEPFPACCTVFHNPAARVQSCFSFPKATDNDFFLPPLQIAGFWVGAILSGMLRSSFMPVIESACSVLVFSKVQLSASCALLWNRRGREQVFLSFSLGNKRTWDHRFPTVSLTATRALFPARGLVLLEFFAKCQAIRLKDQRKLEWILEGGVQSWLFCLSWAWVCTLFPKTNWRGLEANCRVVLHSSQNFATSSMRGTAAQDHSNLYSEIEPVI
jgi:hypothetical protein